MVKDIKNMPDQQIMSIVPDEYGANITKKRDFLYQTAVNLVNENPGLRPSALEFIHDVNFMRDTKLLWPPVEFPSKEKVELTERKSNKKGSNNKNGGKIPFDEAIRAARDPRMINPKLASGSAEHSRLRNIREDLAQHIRTSYEPNLCLVDFRFMEDGGKPSWNFHPVADFTYFFYHMDYVSAPPKVNDIYDIFLGIFWRVSRCIAEYSNNFVLEFNQGDVNKTAFMISRRHEEREKQGLPTRFHRVLLSNVPDYCGLLTSLLTIGPLLYKQKEAKFPCWMQCNVLLNTVIWENYDEYIFSSTMLNGPEEVEEVLGIKQTCGGLFNIDVCWVLTDDAADGKNQKDNKNGKSNEMRVGSVPRASKAQIIRWLHRLYLGICYPAFRDGRKACFEYSPMTISAFILTLVRLYENGIPAHWISSVVETFLTGKRLTTTAQPPVSSPNPQSSVQLTKTFEIYIEPFQEELATLLSLWSRHSNTFFPLYYDALPNDVVECVVTGLDLDDHSYFPTGHGLAPHIGLLVIHEEDEKKVSIGDWYNAVRYHKSDKRKVHMFSALKRPKSVKDEVSFFASRAFAQKLRGEKGGKAWQVIPLRLDSWVMVGPWVTFDKVVLADEFFERGRKWNEKRKGEI
ncbi:hypothetical protein HK102_006891 [Quaeritorhiza haematococci]|nr:hypothetical protein HK102_006891 [Quaeritorhiza haematococci]